MIRQRRLWAALALAGAGAAMSLAAAYACGAQATMTISPTEAMPGQEVAGTGKLFSTALGGGPTAEPVVLHWNSLSGPILWTGRPDSAGNIAFRFVVPPSAAAGSYMLVATQNNADGVAASGTPARVSLTVLPLPVTTTSTSTVEPVTTEVTQPPATILAETPPPASAVAPAAAPVATKTVTSPRSQRHPPRWRSRPPRQRQASLPHRPCHRRQPSRRPSRPPASQW